MSLIEEQQHKDEHTRYQLLGLFKTLTAHFSQTKDLPMKGWLTLNFGYSNSLFDLTVFSDWHKQSNRSFSFYSYDDFEEKKQLAGKVIEAIEADDFERIIELSGHDRRSGVQKYIDKQGPYICPECGRKQHDPLESIEIMTDSTFTIVGGCDECINRSIQDMYQDDMEAME